MAAFGVGLTLLLSQPDYAVAYIGPGAGFAFLGSTFVVLLTVVMAALTIAFWPLQWAWRKARGFGVSKKARARRVIILGLDGLEPKLAERYMQEGRLPNLAKLKAEGCFSRLGTTLPALSPVAWSTFQTGVNPGAHNIFDFLTRDKRFCLPLLSSTKTEVQQQRLCGFLWRRATSKVQLLRKSQPFWKVLSKYGVFSNIIRVPISYPPEKCYGNVLSAMCTPDLRGTQGSFSLFTTRAQDAAIASGDSTTGGEMEPFETQGQRLVAKLKGPPGNDGKPLTVTLELEKVTPEQALLVVCGQTITLSLNQFSDWIALEFVLPKQGWSKKKIRGIARFCLRESGHHISLYVSPINANPEQPVLPIAAPLIFSSWLAKRQGFFGTLGLMEDTWGRNELALDDQRFLDQTWLTHEERERMFFDVLERTREGLCVCVCDASDRIQHMFWRYLDEKHPSAREPNPVFEQAIPKMYERMDALVGKTLERLKQDDVLMVISDHGFASFRRGINLNTWLMQQGMLTLKDGKQLGADYFKDVDWSKTKAFAVGLSGIYINRRGREAQGIVEADETAALKAEISSKLEALRDPKDAAVAVAKVYDTAVAYRGVYATEAPDLVVGYNPGYRVSWDSVTGAVEAEVFSDNVKAWSGDHHVDPRQVPGIFFCNRGLSQSAESQRMPHIADLAPTTLSLFGVPVPGYMEGRALL